MEERRTSRPVEDARRVLERGLDPSCFEEPRDRGAPRTGGDLHICPQCASRLVYPVAWEPADQTRWSVSLRCPDCEWNGGGIYDQTVLDRFDQTLDHGTEAMVADLTAIARVNTEEQIERFADALRHDHILPEDF